MVYNLESIEYSSVREWVLPGDILGFVGTHPVSTIIQTYELLASPIKIRLCHVAGVTTGPSCLQRRLCIQATGDSGVNPIAISTLLKNNDKTVIWFPLLPDFYPYRNAMDLVYWEAVGDGKKYDFRNLFRNIAGNVSTDAKRYFCSEICGEAIRKSIPRECFKKSKRGLHEVELLYDKNKALRPSQLCNLPLFSTPFILLRNGETDGPFHNRSLCE